MSMYLRKPKQQQCYGLIIEFGGVVRCLCKSNALLRPTSISMLLDSHENTLRKFLASRKLAAKSDPVRWYVSSDFKASRDAIYLPGHKELLSRLREEALSDSTPRNRVARQERKAA